MAQSASSPTARHASKRWHQLEGDELAQEVQSIVEGLKGDAGPLREQYLHYLSLYEGVPIERTDATAYLHWGKHQQPAEPLHYPLHRSACDTVQAEIAGRQKPKCMFHTTGADWSTQRRAKKLDKFVEACLRQRQEPYANAWELMEDTWLDAASTGVGIVKVFAGEERIHIERVPCWVDVLIDPCEALTGRPLNWFEVGTIDKDKAIELFCDSGSAEENELRRMAIEGAPPRHSGLDHARVAEEIEIIYAWRIKSLKDKPGKHAIVINGVLMHEQDWERSYPPFIVLRWSRHRIGFWGKGLIEEGEAIAAEVNEQAEKLQRRFRLLGNKRTYYVPGSLDEGALQSNEDENLIPVQPGFELPRESMPNPVAPAEVDWTEANFRRFYELLGVSQMSATARKEPGITAGVAIRTMNDLQSVRFGVKAKAYENAFVELGRHIVDCAREKANEDGDWELPYPGESFHRKISWKEAALENDQFEVMLAPASALPNDPAAKLQTAQELYQSGLIDGQTFKRLLDMPDLQSESEAENAERNYVADLIDRMLDAEQGSFEFIGPDGYLLDKEGAMLLAGREYFQALRRGAPEFNLALLRAWMNMLDKIIARAQMPPPPMPGDPMAAGAMAPPPAGPAPLPPAPGGPAALPPMPPGVAA